MELEGDSPAPRPPEALDHAATQGLHVTPENVVTLAATFRDCADRLLTELPRLRHDMRLPEPWMDDPVSEWARQQFDEYFVDSQHAFVHIVHSQYEQHAAVKVALLAAAQLYGLTEELIKAGFVDAGLNK